MSAGTTSLERVLIILIGVFVTVALLFPLYGWITSQKTPKLGEVCTPDTCENSPNGRICVEKNGVPDCVCRFDGDCEVGKCVREVGSEYGKCA